MIPVVSEACFEKDSEANNLESIVMVFSVLSDGRDHPIHMHGHAFHVVYVGYGNYDNDMKLVNRTTDLECGRQCVNPRWTNDKIPEAVMDRIVNGRVTSEAIQKDTILIPAGGYVVVAINADNPGYWYIHCHIEFHVDGGMIVLLQEYPASQHRAPPPGINNRTFRWGIEQYVDFQDAGDTCDDALAQDDNDTITIPRVWFGFILLILIMLAIACAVLVAVVVILCIKAKAANPEASKEGKFELLSEK